MVHYRSMANQLWKMMYQTDGPDGTGFGTERLDELIHKLERIFAAEYYGTFNNR